MLAILEGISERISENIYKPFHEEQKLIVRQVRELLHSGEDTILSAAPFLDIFVLILRWNFGNVQNDVFGAIYENYLKELYEEQLGQYFTDPAVVNFMLSEVGYQSREIRRRYHKNISIVDPSCGSGTFLYSAVREIVKARGSSAEAVSHRVESDVLTNAFGLDIAEFPLYLAEMSILMRMLPLIVAEKYNNPVDKKFGLYVTEDSLAEFVENLSDGAQPKMDLGWTYHGFMRDEADLLEMKSSLVDRAATDTKCDIPRRRFDFVVGNPPYIGYNQASRAVGVKIFRMMRERSIRLSDIYGWNLHSVPGRRKKYPPKPNLYAFFIALGFALLKEGGRFCYILPQTMLTEPDYDVVRHHLANDHTIDSLIVFSGKLFVGRSTNQKREIYTSSLILVCTKRRPDAKHVVECVAVDDQGGDVEEVVCDLVERRSKIGRSVLQSELLEKIDNWSFVTWNRGLARLHKQYVERSESMAVYSEHLLSETRFGHRFYFDVGFILDRNRESSKSKANNWGLVRFADFSNFTNFKPTVFYDNSEKHIGLPRNSQGYEALYRRHKLLWEKSRSFKFYYTDEDVVPSMSHCQIISSDDRDEIMFLFALLNSSITHRVFEAMFSVGNEKIGMFVTVSRLKDCIRPPLVDSSEKARIKKKIIRRVERALAMEKVVLGELVEFDTLVRRIGDLRVEGRRLLGGYRGTELAFPIRSGGKKVVEMALQQAGVPDGPVPVEQLISLPAFDHVAQATALAEVDELVLDLYGVSKSARRGLRGWRVT